MVLPVTAEVIGGFAGLTMLTKNSYLDEVNKQYVMTARAKGLTERSILRKHVFRNAMLLVIAGFPSAFIGMFFAGSLIIETTFSLNGLGLLGYTALQQRDYPVIFGTLVHVHAPRPCPRADRRSHLHAGRPSNRLRDEADMMSCCPPSGITQRLRAAP